MNQVIGRCPICQDELGVTRLHCDTCGTTIDGTFSLGPLERLSQEQIQFVEAFIRARGSLKDVGAELNMSYPTVNNRLNDILMTLGYGDRVKVPEPVEPVKAPDPVEPTTRPASTVPADRKREILTQLREGAISASDAERLLRGESPEATSV